MSFGQYITARRVFLRDKISELEKQIARTKFTDLYELGRLQGQVIAFELALENLTEEEDRE